MTVNIVLSYASHIKFLSLFPWNLSHRFVLILILKKDKLFVISIFQTRVPKLFFSLSIRTF